MTRPAHAPDIPFEDKRILDAVADSLRRSAGAAIADGELKTLRRQLRAFGLHAARIDVRQHSAWHEAAVSEILSQLAGGQRRWAEYAVLDEGRKVAVLDEALAQPVLDALGPPGAWGDETRSVTLPLRDPLTMKRP